ncbi:hypothetical protein LNTAR_21770 [Lentisphaera araneosa HTCC2155]|uniref:Uncharacterized protein n=1 Tax=Lentisphaera araneosa HTCC2155 TaxID=313628 RepID=A6DM88_9BACT|nr:hypothetical protein [Lentisphaera araneosa]EDM27386.1 hypothetical protein LNTAR_21770 [Lentisphaera araneosa HTCC2155]
MKKIGITISIIGILLHMNTCFIQSDTTFGFNILLLVFSSIPYVSSLIILKNKKSELIGSLAPALPIITDSVAYYSVFIAPSSSTAPLALIFIPLWNLIIFMPLGIITGLIIQNLKRNKL